MRFPETLVLGATGRIGGVLRQLWPQMGDCGGVLWQSRRGRAAEGGEQSLNWVVFDPVQEPAALAQAAAGRRAILCLAGAVPGRGCDLADNARLAAAAVRAGAAAGSRVLLCSSAAVYGNQPGCLAEDSPLRPAAPYGAAKAEMERQAAHLAAGLQAEACCLRIGNIAGLDAILGGWRPGFRLDRFSDGRSPARSYTGAGELARMQAELLSLPQLPPVLNVAQPGVVEMAGLLDAAGLAWAPQPAPTSAIARVELDTGCLQALLAAPPPAADAVEMIRQWSLLEPHLNTELKGNAG